MKQIEFLEQRPMYVAHTETADHKFSPGVFDTQSNKVFISSQDKDVAVKFFSKEFPHRLKATIFLEKHHFKYGEVFGS